MSSKDTQWEQWQILLGLMAPATTAAIYVAMFSVAIPIIRAELAIQPDMAAWIVTIYSLPFMIFMPLHGRLADAFGMQRLFLFGVGIFLFGTLIAGVAPNLGWLMAGRAVQGFGSAGFTPLALATVARVFSKSERGKLMGTWNIAYPIAGLIGPLIGGLLIDHIGWRVIFWPTILIALLTLWIVKRQVPALPGFADRQFLRRFDWGGTLLLSAGATSLLFYVSSRPITGIPAMQDWRLLAATLLFLSALIFWEKRQMQPLIPIELFAQSNFTLASICAAIRMFIMNSLRFLIALYVVDLYGLDATITGLIITSHAVPLFLMLRLGGQLADRWGSRWPVVLSMLIQAAVMLYLAYLPAEAPVAYIVIGVLGQSIGASLSLAPLHRSSMADIEDRQTGVAAGLYSMIRFTGAILGTALSGVLLQQRLAEGMMVVDAYQGVFFFIGIVALVGVAIGYGLKQ